jgi:NAD(P)-dependent dehydrogenase (short-subunit alcohol dehydrogenase family)
MKLDLSSLADVRAFAKQFEAAKLPLDVLILNAGVMMGK